MRRWHAALVCVVIVFAAAPNAQGEPFERVPPFDVGCIGDPPCATPWERARDGLLEGSTVPFACIVYGPPFVLPCFTDVDSSTGIYVDVAAAATITVAASVRSALPVPSPQALSTRACFSLRDSIGHGYSNYGCAPIGPGEPTLLATTFENAHLQPGRYLVFLSVGGGPGSVMVERMSFELTS